MTGKITIEAAKSGCLLVESELRSVGFKDKLAIIDVLAKIFELTQEERFEIGAIIAIGGVDKLPGCSTEELRIDSEFLKRMKNKEK